MVALKRCKDCGIEKPLSDFYAMRGMRDGFRNQCKLCFAERRRASYDS